MKKFFIAILLVMFMGFAIPNVYASSSGAQFEIEGPGPGGGGGGTTPPPDEEPMPVTLEEKLSSANTYDVSIAIPYQSYSGKAKTTYNMNVNNNNIVQNASARITFITHGLGNNASAWSNDGNNFTTLKYNYDSVINKLRCHYNADVYFAQFVTRTYYRLYKLNPTNYNVRTQVGHIVDTNKHSVVVFEAYKPLDYNDNIYYQFNVMASNIVNDYKFGNELHRLPKINLIGHSRGGITNMQYALDHPDLVENMFSIDTPFMGSTTAVLYDVAADFNLSDDVQNSPGLSDITDPSVYYTNMYRWNNNYDDLYSNINMYALGGYSTVGLLLYQALYPYLDPTDRISAKNIISYNMNVLGNIGNLGDFAIDFIEEYILFPILDNIDENYVPFQLLYTLIEIIIEDAEIVNGQLVFYNDVCVDLGSQLGQSTINGGYQYEGFIKVVKRFDMNNCQDYQLNKVCVDEMPVVHNIVTRDQEYISYIISRL